jgi:carboxyl-terminal processing protease
MDTQHDRFEPAPRAQPDAARPDQRSEATETSNASRPAAIAPLPPRPRKRGLSRVAGITLAALLIFSGLFTAFAAGMVTQRAVNGGPATAAAAPSGAPSSIDEAWNLVHSQYVDPSAINDDKMTEAAIDGMLATLHDEGHTRYQTAAETQSENEQLSGEYVGVGIQVDTKDDRIVVVAPIDGSPAAEAGVQAGDLLRSVNGTDVTGKTVDDVIGDIRGQEGTQVTLVFDRPSVAEPVSFTLTRRKIAVSAVSWAMLPGNIADIRLSQFSTGAGDDVAHAITAAKTAGATSIIFDLRNDPGGYIDEALHVASLFVPDGSTIFISQVRDGTRTPHLSTDVGVNTGELPLVVLINEGSASSSEIVAGAIKSNNPHATLIGETTFGTGTVLSSYDLGDGSSLLIGTELWLTPEGKLIKNEGVRPDVTVGLPQDQFPFVPVTNAIVDPNQIKDHQLEWAIGVITTGQAGSDHPTLNTPPGRSN